MLIFRLIGVINGQQNEYYGSIEKFKRILGAILAFADFISDLILILNVFLNCFIIRTKNGKSAFLNKMMSDKRRFHFDRLDNFLFFYKSGVSTNKALNTYGQVVFISYFYEACTGKEVHYRWTCTWRDIITLDMYGVTRCHLFNFFLMGKSHWEVNFFEFDFKQQTVIYWNIHLTSFERLWWYFNGRHIFMIFCVIFIDR